MTNTQLTVKQSSFGKIIAINVNILFAVGCYFYGAWLWPTDPKWWGFGFVAICAWGASFGLGLKALKQIFALYKRDKMLANFQSNVKQQKDAELASKETLKKAGMIDG